MCEIVQREPTILCERLVVVRAFYFAGPVPAIVGTRELTNSSPHGNYCPVSIKVTVCVPGVSPLVIAIAACP